jgi:uncharacterized DUF497 family protein
LIYKFEWNNKKAATNKVKHKISFQEAATVFKDRNALSIYDNEHSDQEDRWITLGLSNNGKLIVVNHTFLEIDKETNLIRVISARKATKKEIEQYNA